jgi:hypothetical protein
MSIQCIPPAHSHSYPWAVQCIDWNNINYITCWLLFISLWFLYNLLRNIYIFICKRTDAKMLTGFQWWESAMNSLLYFRALIFVWRNKGLIVIRTFYLNGALISPTLCSMQQVTSFQNQQDLKFFPENQRFKIKWLIRPTTACFGHRYSVFFCLSRAVTYVVYIQYTNIFF